LQPESELEEARHFRPYVFGIVAFVSLIRVYDDAGSEIEMHERAGDFKNRGKESGVKSQLRKHSRAGHLTFHFFEFEQAALPNESMGAPNLAQSGPISR
jgi:hypothetical protein